MTTYKMRVVALLGISVILTLGVSLSADRESPSKASHVRALDDLRTAYVSLGSFHLRAKFTLKRLDGERVEGTGTYEHWQEGEKYRVASRTDERLGFAPDYDMAFDGQRYCILREDVGVMSCSDSDARSHMQSLPNPLLLPFDFLDQAPPDCAVCRLRFRDLGDRRYWDLKLENGQAVVRQEDKSRADRLRERSTYLRVGAVGLNGEPFDFRVHFENQFGWEVPERIDRIAKGGWPLSSIEFVEYGRESRGVPFPRLINLVVGNPKSLGRDAPILLAEVEVALDTGSSPEPALFTLDPARAEDIWDVDNEVFLKSRGQWLRGF